MNPSLRDRLRSIGIFAGYSAFFVSALIAALVLTFPARQLKAYVESESRRAGVPVRIGEMSLRGLGGITLEDIDVKLPAKAAQEGSSARPPVDLHLDELRLDVALWRALWKREIEVRMNLLSGGGALEDGTLVLIPIGGDDASRVKDSGAKDGKDGKTGKTGNDSKDAPAAVRRGYAFELDLPVIDKLPLGKMGLGTAALAFQDKVNGNMDGLLSGSVRIHWGGTFEDATGDIQLTITDAVIKRPSIEIPKMGKLELADLRMGTFGAKITMAHKSEIAVLAGARGSEKSTAIAMEKVETFGRDIELVVEERSHVLIPPGPAGLKMATIQVHFVFALPKNDGKELAEADGAKNTAEGGPDEGSNGDEAGKGDVGGKAGKGGKGAKDSKETSGSDAARAKWSSILELAGDKLKPFTRNGYVGMTCSGLLARPNCTPDTPRVTVGTRRAAAAAAATGAPVEAADPVKPNAEVDAGAPPAEPAPVVAEPVPARPLPPSAPTPERIELRPAMQDNPQVPRAAPALGGPPRVEQNNEPNEQDEAAQGRGRDRPGTPAEANDEEQQNGEEQGGAREPQEEGEPGDERARPAVEGEGEGEPPAEEPEEPQQ